MSAAKKIVPSRCRWPESGRFYGCVCCAVNCPSRPGEQVFADVHLYYHPAAAETKYDGSIQIGFFSSPLELKPTFTVKPDASPENQGIVGIVSDKPGIYRFTIGIDATPTQGGAARQIREQVQVTVR